MLPTTNSFSLQLTFFPPGFRQVSAGFRRAPPGSTVFRRVPPGSAGFRRSAGFC